MPMLVDYLHVQMDKSGIHVNRPCTLRDILVPKLVRMVFKK